MQRSSVASLPFIIVLLAMVGIVAAAAPKPEAEPASVLATPQSFDKIADKAERSRALFVEAGKVITHPRCMNCHPAGDRPAQGNDSHPHQPLVIRGADGMGAPAMRCTACHQEKNYPASGVPGVTGWHIAPIEMAWQGKSLGEICAQIKDPKRNGGKDLVALHKHMAEDELVGWGWAPGGKRTPAPGTQKEFGEVIKAWIDTGAECPAS